MVSAAVKEAFMEVDGEAPGGWQGWRMWDEMVSGDATLVPDLTSRDRVIAYGQEGFGHDGFDGLGIYGVDPVQDATMNMGNYAVMDDTMWSFDGMR